MRSSWKGIYTNFNYIDQMHLKNNKVLLNRNATITGVIANSLQTDFQVHTGQKLLNLSLRGAGAGFKAGSFTFTKAMGSRIHSNKKKTEKKRK